MFVDNRDLTREERTEAASDFLTKGRDSDTIRAVMVLTNEISTLRSWLKELEGERDAVSQETLTQAGELTDCRAVIGRVWEALGIANFEGAGDDVAESVAALRARLKGAEEANTNLMEEHQALVRNAAVERKEAREEIAALKGRQADA